MLTAEDVQLQQVHVTTDVLISTCKTTIIATLRK